MKLVSKVALAAALSLGAPALLATPAAAQKNKKEEAGGQKLELSKEFRAAAAPADAAVRAKDFATAGPALTAAAAVAKNDDEKYWVAQMQYDVARQTNNEPAQIAALDLLIANPKTPAEVLPTANFIRGRYLVTQKKYAEAIQYLNRARQLNANQPDLPLQLAMAQLESGNIDAGIGELDKAIAAEEAAGRKAPENWYKFAASKLYRANKKDQASQWLMRQIKAYPSAEGWRSVALIYMEQNAEKGTNLGTDVKLDLYRLMRATGSLAGESDYFEYANAAKTRGLPWETVKVIEEGRAKGKANSSSFTQLMTSAQAGVKAEGSLDGLAKQATSAATGKPASNTADAFLASGNYAKAAELYRLALSKGGANADEVNTRLGIALAMAGQKAEAKTAFAAVQTAPRADIARFWTAWVDQGAAPAATASAN